MSSNSRILVIIALLCGCSQNIINRNPAYSFAPALSNPQLAVCLERNGMKIDCQGIAGDPDTAATREKAYGIFEHSVLSAVLEKTLFRNAVLECAADDSAFGDTVCVAGFLRGPKRKIPVPGKNAVLAFAKSKPDFFLRISNISIVSAARGPKDVTLSADFVLWDVSSRRAVTYGHASVARGKKTFSGSKQDWDTAGSLFVDRLFQEMPLMKKVPLTRR
jgi:hypothetical protein